MRASHVCKAVACLAAGILTGCGSAQTSGLSPSSAGTLRSRLAAVASDAARGDRAGALAALSAVSAGISREAPQLTSDERTALETGIARTRRAILATVPTPATTTATTTSAPAPTPPATTSTPAPGPPPPAEPKGGHGPARHGSPGHDHGHGHGHKGGD